MVLFRIFFGKVIFKVFIELCYSIASVLCLFFFFDHETCRTLVPQPRVEPTLPALKGEVLTAGPPGKSLKSFIFVFVLCCKVE